MESFPLISIVTVSYNAVSTIEETILSVINQTYPNIEYIIIDGGSTDGTVDIIKKYQDKIAYWVSEPDEGIYNAMNKGVIQSHGKYCIFMNSGDYFFHDALSNVFKQEMNEDVISGIAKIDNRMDWKPISKDKLSLFYFYVAGLCHQATFIKRELLLKNPYDENLRIVSDSKFFIETFIIKNYSYISIPVKICKYDTNGISSNKYDHEKELTEVFFKLFPERIIIDYENMFLWYNPFFRLLFPIVNSKFFVLIMSFCRKGGSIIYKLVVYGKVQK
jgi:glycosyltransferase involved in cell wall biosynthesis